MSFPQALELLQKTHKDPGVAFPVMNNCWCRRLDETKSWWWSLHVRPLEIAHSEKETGANKGNPFQEPKEEKTLKKIKCGNRKHSTV